MNEIVVIENAHALTVTAPLDQNPALVYIASLASPQSRRTMIAALNTIVDILNGVPRRKTRTPFEKEGYLSIRWENLRFQHVAAIRSELIQRQYTATTANKILSAVKSVLKSAYNLDLISDSDYKKATSVKRVDGQSLPAGRDLSLLEINALLKVCEADKTVRGIRDAAIIAILRSSGCRRSELININVEDIDMERGAIKILHGKRNKERIVYCKGAALDKLKKWLEVRGKDNGALLLRIDQLNAITEDRLTAQAIYFILNERGSEAGLDRFSPHDFRRSFVGDMLEITDIVTVQRLVGHSSPTTTAKYDRRSESVKEKAVESLMRI